MLKLKLSIVLILFFTSLTYAQTFDELMSSAQHEIDFWNSRKAIDFYYTAEELNSENAHLYFMRGTAKSDVSDKERRSK